MNAKKELLDELQDKPVVLCASIYVDKIYKERTFIALKLGHTQQEFENFLNQLDFNYNPNYGSQHVYGIVWFVDGSWLERGEYDGSEWWEYKQTPSIPDELK